MNQNAENKGSNLENDNMVHQNTESNDDYVFYFDSRKGQMLFEFWLLVVLLVLSVIAIIFNIINIFGLSPSIRTSAFSVIGGFLGGWVFVTKWFYRVTARGKDNQKKWRWEPHKIYWRIFTPFISAIVAFALYSITISGIFTLITLNRNSNHAAFGLCFLLGYFSDILLSKMFDWTTLMWGSKDQKGEKYCA